jgi:hypothetical protein
MRDLNQEYKLVAERLQKSEILVEKMKRKLEDVQSLKKQLKVISLSVIFSLILRDAGRRKRHDQESARDAAPRIPKGM